MGVGVVSTRESHVAVRDRLERINILHAVNMRAISHDDFWRGAPNFVVEAGDCCRTHSESSFSPHRLNRKMDAKRVDS